MSKRKLPGASGSGNGGGGCPNQDFVDFLFELSNYERNVNRNTFKSNAYRKAAGVLANLDQRITSGDEARKLDGIGAKIAEKIDEFIRTGKLRKLEKIRADDSNTAINLFTRVAGIGPAKARALVDQGHNDLQDLRKDPDAAGLSKAQKIGLKHFDDFEKRIPRAEISRIEAKIVAGIRAVDPKFRATICGSFRRGLPSSGDVDVLLTHPDFRSSSSGSGSLSGRLLRSVVDRLEKDEGLITDTISHGDTKFMGVCRLQEDLPFRRLDIRIIPQDQYFCGVLYFTGSDQFNKAMRAHALEKGFTLNEYTLKPLDRGHQPLEPLPIICEEDIFDYICFNFRTPEERSW